MTGVIMAIDENKQKALAVALGRKLKSNFAKAPIMPGYTVLWM